MADDNIDAVAAEYQRRLVSGLTAGVIFLTNQVKKKISEPAPRKRVKGKRGKKKGVIYYRATTPATPGAPPRKLSGTLRQRVNYRIEPDGSGAVIGAYTPYAARLEYEGHPYLADTIDENLTRFQEIVLSKLA